MPAVLDRMAFTITCPRDGHDLRLEANGTPGRWETRAVLSCTHCHGRFVVAVQLLAEEPVGGRRDVTAGAIPRTRVGGSAA